MKQWGLKQFGSRQFALRQFNGLNVPSEPQQPTLVGPLTGRSRSSKQIQRKRGDTDDDVLLFIL